MQKRMWISKKQSYRNLHPPVKKSEPGKIEQMYNNHTAPEFLVKSLQAQKAKNPGDLSQIVETVLGELEGENEEPVLVDLDEDGFEVRNKVTDYAWQKPTGEFAEEAFIACHIKKWGSRKQKARWNKIVTEMRSVYGEEIKVRRAWIQNIIAWAKRKNEGRYAVAITMDNLISAVDNSGYEAFKKQYFEQHREE